MTRSISPESSRRNVGGQIPRSKSAFEPAGRQVPDTAVTIYKSEAERVADAPPPKRQRKRKRKHSSRPRPVQTDCRRRSATSHATCCASWPESRAPVQPNAIPVP
ncbi:hypothetical protein MY10362_005428 [Beauveria mimosiformis]